MLEWSPATKTIQQVDVGQAKQRNSNRQTAQISNAKIQVTTKIKFVYLYYYYIDRAAQFDVLLKRNSKAKLIEMKY